MKLIHSLLALSALSLCISCSNTLGIESDGFEEMGISYMQKGNYEKSKVAFEKARAMNPDDPELLYNSILSLCSLEEFSLALEQAQEGYKKYPNYLEFIIVQIKIYTSTGDYPSALQQQKKLMEIKPNDEGITAHYLTLLDTYMTQLQESNVGIIPNFSTLQTLNFTLNTLITTAQSLLESETYHTQALTLLIKYYPNELQYQIYLYEKDRKAFENLFHTNVLILNSQDSSTDSQTQTSPQVPEKATTSKN